jgi:hypothetical protein
VGVWFMPAILSKREMNDGAMALTRGMKRAMRTGSPAAPS